MASAQVCGLIGSILSDPTCRAHAFAPGGALGPEPGGAARLAACAAAAAGPLLDADAAWSAADRAAAGWCLRALALHPAGAAAVRQDPAAAAAAERLRSKADPASARCGQTAACRKGCSDCCGFQR